MLVVMQAHATEEQVRAVCQKIESLGYNPHPVPGAGRTAVCITGNKGEVEPGTLDEMPGVQEVIRVTKPYKLVSRDIKEENTVISFPGTDATIDNCQHLLFWCCTNLLDFYKRLGVSDKIRWFGAIPLLHRFPGVTVHLVVPSARSSTEPIAPPAPVMTAADIGSSPLV